MGIIQLKGRLQVDAPVVVFFIAQQARVVSGLIQAVFGKTVLARQLEGKNQFLFRCFKGAPVIGVPVKTSTQGVCFRYPGVFLAES